MAGLFDDKSLRIPPQMGKAARSKLNKHGFFRMPPNMKGVPAAAKGGLGGAHSKGRKIRGFSGENGSFVDRAGKNGTPIGGLAGEDDVQPLITSNYIESIDPQDDEGLEERLGGLAAEEEVQSAKSWDVPDQVNAITQGRDRIAQIQQAQQDYQAKAEDYLNNFRNPNEGAMNIPALQFAAGMMSPTKTGSFGEGMGYGIGAGASALANQRKQDLEFEALRTKLGLDVSKTPLESQLKLADLEEKAAYHKELMDYRNNPPAKAAEDTPISQNIVMKLTKQADTLDRLKGLSGSFKPEYGGFVANDAGDVAKWLASRKDDVGDVSSWWREYNDYAQFVRHDLYGSAFTKTEQDAWDATNIMPGMHPDKISENLGKRKKLLSSFIKKQVGGLEAAGYNPKKLKEFLVGEEEGGDSEKETPELKIPEGYTQEQIEEYNKLRGKK